MLLTTEVIARAGVAGGLRANGGMAKRAKQEQQTYNITADVLREVITQSTRQPREKREPGHMTQFFWWPLAMVLTFPFLVACALTLLMCVCWWGVRELSTQSAGAMPWQLAVVMFVIVYCIDVLFAAKKWVPFVVNQWAGPKTLATLAGTTTVKHERSEPHLVRQNVSGGHVLRSLADKMADAYEHVTGKTEPEPQIEPWVQDEYDALMCVWPDNQGFTRETFRPLVGYQAKYSKYTKRWASLGFIEKLSGNGGWRFIVGLDDVFEKMPELLPCSGLVEPENGDR